MKTRIKITKSEEIVLPNDTTIFLSEKQTGNAEAEYKEILAKESPEVLV